MMALMLCLAAAPVLQADPASKDVPVSESLRKVLVNVGLELTEQHLYGQQRSEEAPPFMVLMPGLARGCHSTELMRSYLSSCRAGTSALTMVFQFGHRQVPERRPGSGGVRELGPSRCSRVALQRRARRAIL